MRCCRASTRYSMDPNSQARHAMRAGFRPRRSLLRASLVLDEDVDRLHDLDFLVVGKLDDDLVVVFGDHEIFRPDRGYRILNVLLLLKGIPNLRNRARAFSGDLLDRPLNGEVLVEGRQDAHADQCQKADDDRPEHQPEQRDASLLHPAMRSNHAAISLSPGFGAVLSGT